MVIPTKLPMHGPSQNVMAALISEKKTQAHQLAEKNNLREELPACSLNNPKVYGVHESPLHRVIFMWHSLGKNLRN